jgi:hypothetical protein
MTKSLVLADLHRWVYVKNAQTQGNQARGAAKVNFSLMLLCAAFVIL